MLENFRANVLKVARLDFSVVTSNFECKSQCTKT